MLPPPTIHRLLSTYLGMEVKPFPSKGLELLLPPGPRIFGPYYSPAFKTFQKKMQMFSVQWPGDDANVFEQLLMINRRCRQAGTKKRNMIKEENFQANEVRAEAAGCYPTITYIFRCARTSQEMDGTLKIVHVQVGRTHDPLYLY